MKGEKYLFVVAGPSGTGKDTVVAALLKKHPEEHNKMGCFENHTKEA